MGFYFDLSRNDASGDNILYSEGYTPQVFWILFGIAGFALTCMGLAAYGLLGNLLKTGDSWDLLLVALIFSAVPIYLLIGIKLLWVRKYLKLEADNLVYGFRLKNWPLFPRKISKTEITGCELINRRPSPNVATRVHDDQQYHIRGHWKVMVTDKTGKTFVLDSHVEREALLDLFGNVQAWLGLSATSSST